MKQCSHFVYHWWEMEYCLKIVSVVVVVIFFGLSCFS